MLLQHVPAGSLLSPILLYLKLYINVNVFQQEGIYNLAWLTDNCGFYSILFYPITLEGRRGTTDEFATIHFHLAPFSAAPAEPAKSTPVQSLILSSHLFFCLPLSLCPFAVPCRIVFALSLFGEMSTD